MATKKATQRPAAKSATRASKKAASNKTAPKTKKATPKPKKVASNKTAPPNTEYRQIERLPLSEVGRLTKKERSFIKDWLLDNFCDENSYACDLYEYEDGGLLLEDPEDNVGGDDGAFGVHLIEQKAGGTFFALLFEHLQEGVLYDRKAQKTAGLVIEGGLTDVARGYDELAQLVVDCVPGLASPKRSKPRGGGSAAKKTATGAAGRSAGGPSSLAEWRALFPGADAQKTIGAVVAGLKRGLKEGGYLFSAFQRETGLPLKKQPQDPFDWLLMAKTLILDNDPFDGLVLRDVEPLAVFTDLEQLQLSVADNTDLSALAGLTNLVDLSIVGGENVGWEWLARLERLEKLSVSGSESSEDVDVSAHRLCVRDNKRLVEL